MIVCDIIYAIIDIIYEITSKYKVKLTFLTCVIILIVLLFIFFNVSEAHVAYSLKSISIFVLNI